MSLPRTVLVTGCSDGGIGSALAAAFLSQGFHVFATARDLTKMTKLPKDGRISFLQLDVTKSEDIKAAVNAVTKHTGGTLDYLVNNAARNHYMPLLDDDLDVCRRLFDSNTFGPIAVTQAFAPLIIESKGSIIFVTSIGGYTNLPYMGTYNASKRALEIMAETLRLEMEPFGVRVLSIVVGAVETMINSHFDDLMLPPTSLYKPVEQKFRKLAMGYNPFSKMPADEFAKSAMKDILSTSRGRVWHGSAVGLLKTLSGWAPQLLTDWIFAKDTGVFDLYEKKG